MKLNRNLIIPLLVILVVIHGCNSKSINKERKSYNGIDSQILNIVDSIQSDFPERTFITVWFTMGNDSNYIIRFLNTLLIPVPAPPPAPIKETLISEDDGFVGYKKYDSICLVFLDTYSDGYFDKFVRKDSLKFDEEPFKDWYKLWENNRENPSKSVEKIYSINKNDSLVFVGEK